MHIFHEFPKFFFALPQGILRPLALYDSAHSLGDGVKQRSFFLQEGALTRASSSLILFSSSFSTFLRSLTSPSSSSREAVTALNFSVIWSNALPS
jgi:hypothetical protein